MLYLWYSHIKINNMENKIFVLNPDYHFKNDIDRVALFSGMRVNDYSEKDWSSYIHPLQAMILNSFSEEKSLKDQYNELSSTLSIPVETVETMIKPYMENETSVYTEFAGEEILFPKNVLISRDKLKGARKIECEDYSLFDCENVNLKQDRLHKAPQTMLFMVTSKCVTNCKYCYADRKTKYDQMSTEQILKIIDEAASLKMTNVDVIGGELFCLPDWNVIIKKLVDYHMTPTYISTKCPISRNMVKKLYETGYDDVVQISLDSMRDDVLGNIIGTKTGYVEKIKKTISYLQEYGFQIQIDTILTNLNSSSEELMELYDYIKDIKNFKHWEIRVPEVSIYTPSSFSEVQASKETIKQLGIYIREELIPKSKVKIYYSDQAINDIYGKGKADDLCFEGGRCDILKDRMFVLPDGKVTICEQLYWHPQFIFGDLTKQSIEEVWNSPKAKALFAFHNSDFEDSSCSNCGILDFCNTNKRRCYVKTVKAYGPENWNYPDPRCEFSPKVESGMIYR